MPTYEGAPPISGLDDLITEDEARKLFGISKITFMRWRYGKDGKPPIPYLRLNNHVYVSKTQLVWWLNELQKQVDPYHAKFQRSNTKGLQVGRRKKSVSRRSD